MKLEIINPSDKCFLDTEDIEAGAIATLLISKGSYALVDEKGEKALPLMLFGSEDILKEFWMKRYGHELEDFLNDPLSHKRLADVCNTFYYTHERTSLNNIGKAFGDFGKYHEGKSQLPNVNPQP